MGAFESGQTFLAGVLARLPENIRAQVKEGFDKPEAKDALVLLGDGTLARSDYSKQMDDHRKQLDDLKKKNDELDDLREQHETWYAENHAALQRYVQIAPEYETLKGRGTNGEVKPPIDPPKAGMTKEELDAILTEREKGHAAVLALTNTLSSRHYQMFNEALDMQAVMGHAIKNHMALETAYEAIHGEKVQKRHKDAEDKRINDEVDKRYAERLKQNPQSQPFPLRDSSPSPLDALSAERKPGDYNVDSALAEYDRLQSGRQTA